MQIRVGQRDTEHVVIDILDQVPDDYGWLNAEVAVSVGAWSGRFGACLRTPDFPRFRQQLEHLLANPSATASFTTLEQQLELKFLGNLLGHIKVEGQAVDQAGVGNRLQFSLDIDQSYLPDLINELLAVERRFPPGTLK